MKEPWNKELVGLRTKSVRENTSPGPAAYDTFDGTFGKVPAIKMKSRRELPKEKSDVPYYNIQSTIGQTTPITMHARTRTLQPEDTPGPTYIPPPLGANARKCGFSGPDYGKSSRPQSARRKRRDNETPGPGPGKYSNRSKDFDAKGTKGVQIKGSHKFGFETTYSPGPAAYKPNYDSVRRRAPKTAIHEKHKSTKVEVTPGYRWLGSTLSGPMYTIKGRDDKNEVCLI